MRTLSFTFFLCLLLLGLTVSSYRLLPPSQLLRKKSVRSWIPCPHSDIPRVKGSVTSLNEGLFSEERIIKTGRLFAAFLICSNTMFSLPSLADDSIAPPAEMITTTVTYKPSLHSDEFIIQFDQEMIGLKLTEQLYKGAPITVVAAIRDPVLLANHPELRNGAIITKVNDRVVEGTSLSFIVDQIKSAVRPLYLQFHDPSRFFELLNSRSVSVQPVVSTRFLPANTLYALYNLSLLLSDASINAVNVMNGCCKGSGPVGARCNY